MCVCGGGVKGVGVKGLSGHGGVRGLPEILGGFRFRGLGG